MSRSNLERSIKPTIDNPILYIYAGEYVPRLLEPILEACYVVRDPAGKIIIREVNPMTIQIKFLPKIEEFSQGFNWHQAMLNSFSIHTQAIVKLAQTEPWNMISVRYGSAYGLAPIKMVKQLLATAGINYQKTNFSLPGERQKRIVRMGIAIKNIPIHNTPNQQLWQKVKQILSR